MFVNQFMVNFLKRFFEQLVLRENFGKYADRLFDLIEEMVEDTETQWDDRVLLPLLQMVRGLLGGVDGQAN